MRVCGTVVPSQVQEKAQPDSPLGHPLVRPLGRPLAGLGLAPSSPRPAKPAWGEPCPAAGAPVPHLPGLCPHLASAGPRPVPSVLCITQPAQWLATCHWPERRLSRGPRRVRTSLFSLVLCRRTRTLRRAVLSLPDGRGGALGLREPLASCLLLHGGGDRGLPQVHQGHPVHRPWPPTRPQPAKETGPSCRLGRRETRGKAEKKRGRHFRAEKGKAAAVRVRTALKGGF